MSKYPFTEIEKKWREIWEEQNLYTADMSDTEKKLYCLVMFLYPSGDRLHIGHPTLIYGEFDNRRVGINTTSPTETFEVNGNSRLRGDLIFSPGNNRYLAFPDGSRTLIIGGNAANEMPK